MSIVSYEKKMEKLLTLKLTVQVEIEKKISDFVQLCVNIGHKSKILH